MVMVMVRGRGRGRVVVVVGVGRVVGVGLGRLAGRQVEDRLGLRCWVSGQGTHSMVTQVV